MTGDLEIEKIDLERIKRPWEDQYRDDDVETMPWFCPELDKDIANAIQSMAISPTTALDIGAGSGTQTIELARLGFESTGTDISPSAVFKARERAKKEGLNVSFVCDDILDSKLETRFGLIMDRGCFHVLAADQRQAYINAVAYLLDDDGVLLLKTFHKQETRKEGPPNRFEADDINAMFASAFELITSSDSVFESTLDSDPKALFCVLRKSTGDIMSNDLFSSIDLAGQALSNRMVMAPMTRNRAPNNIANAMMAEHYAQRASAGLIITEGTQISNQAVGYPATPGIFTQAHIDGWQLVTDAVHTKSGCIFAQLWHCGRISHPDFHVGELPVGPSAIAAVGDAFTYGGLKPFLTPRALETSEITDIVDQYRHAAACAMKAGFDGVEIHAANGYLIDQFIRDGSNQRTDQYGGSLENRLRFLLEIVEAVGNEIGFNKVGVRLSPVNAFNDISDSDPQVTFNHVAAALNGLDLAYLHVVEVDMTGATNSEFDMSQLRDHFDGLYIGNGGYDKIRGNQSIAEGRVDLISFGIPYLANPDLPERWRIDASLNEADQSTFYGGDEHGYTDYPALSG